jgi:exopolysaccharide biosynthesis glucuronosyltransferase PssE
MASLIVFGNSERHFHRLVNAVCDCFPLFPKPVVIQAGIHQADFKRISDEATVLSVVPYVEFDELLKTSEVIVCHGGSGITQSALRLGKHPAVVSRRKKFGEHIDDHQVEWCLMLRDEGLATYVEDTGDLERYLRKRQFANLSPRASDKFLGNSWIRRDLQRFIRETIRGTL